MKLRRFDSNLAKFKFFFSVCYFGETTPSQGLDRVPGLGRPRNSHPTKHILLQIHVIKLGLAAKPNLCEFSRDHQHGTATPNLNSPPSSR